MPPTGTENPFLTPGGSPVLADLSGEGTVYGSGLPPITVIVELDGKVVGDAIKDETLNSSLSGSFSEVNRTSRFAPRNVIPE
jgi:hypothetical protein